MQLVDFQQALRCLQNGEVLIYPTETCYGIGVDVQNPEAVKQIFTLKGRDPQRPVSILLPSLSDIVSVTASVSKLAAGLISRYLPGPLTLVLPAHPKLNPQLHADTGWIGVRVSSHPMAAQLLKAFGGPITTTSANPSGAQSGARVNQLVEYFSESSVFCLSGGDLPASKGSTVVKVESDQLSLLREGEIPFSEIKKSISPNS